MLKLDVLPNSFKRLFLRLLNTCRQSPFPPLESQIQPPTLVVIN